MKLLTNPKSHRQPFLKECLYFLHSFLFLVSFITVLLEKHTDSKCGVIVVVFRLS